MNLDSVPKLQALSITIATKKQVIIHHSINLKAMRKYKSSPFKNEKLDLIISKILAVNSDHAYIEKAKNERIQRYTEQRDMLEIVSDEKIQNWNFAAEVLNLAFLLERQDYWFKRIADKIVKLERHAYAPELNTLHFKNGKQAKVSNCTTIGQASTKLINGMSIEQLRDI